MNSRELQMVDLLRSGKDDFGVVAVKAEFEAEGTRIDELLRLVDISRAAGLELTVKIGGSEAIRDLYESKQIGVKYIVAPMVETPYSLSKYAGAVALAYDSEERSKTDFLFNLETITAYNHIDEIIEIASTSHLAGLVFGRVDFVGSLGKSRDEINSPDITSYVLSSAEKARSANLDFVLGGAISSDSLPVIKEVAKTYLTRFETRKIVFSGEAANLAQIDRGLLNAVHFELLWLLNKRDYYSRITSEDAKRIEMLDSRWKILSQQN